ncbi:MAG: hypothetical protein ABI461_12020 [Polyangiaceae bacterium]
MTVETLSAWLLTAMVAFSPPQAQREGEAAALVRYGDMAQDFARIALDEAEAPLFEGDSGRPQTALLMAAVASYESGYRSDVDVGTVKGDHGKALCIMQVQVYGKTAENYTRDEVMNDRQKCLKVALHRMRQSFTMCHSLKLVNRLAGYTVGSCKEEEKSEWRVLRALNFWKAHPFKDVDPMLIAPPTVASVVVPQKT